MSTADFRGTERFLIQRQLGSGGFGVVYEARDIEKDALVALKTLRYTSPEALYRFKREFRSLADIAHRNLVQLYELVSDSDELFFTMELVHGRSFIEYVWNAAKSPVVSGSRRDHATQSDVTEPALMATVDFTTPPAPAVNDTVPIASTDQTPADLQRLTSAMTQLVEGLAAIHRDGHIHRDIKPSNVLVTDEGRVVLLDFGLLTDLESEVAHQSVIAGTPVYMSPEQAAGLPLSVATDWYSVGIMLFQSLTGQLPFNGTFLDLMMAKQSAEPPPPSRLVAGVPPHLDLLSRDLLRRDPPSRPGVDEILERLENPEWRSTIASVVPARAPAGAAPFVGREPQLAALQTAFDQTLAGSATTVCVHGPSGIGKSSLVRRFLDGVRSSNPEAVVLSGRCYERESVPYKALDSLVDSMARHLRGLSSDQVDAVRPRDTTALAQLFPVLRQFEERMPARRRAAPVPDVQEQRRRAFAAFREMLVRFGDKAPLILFVDDLQWGDVDSADLIREALRTPEPPALLFIAAYRSDEVESSRFLRAFLANETKSLLNITDVPVDRLSAEASRDLAEALLQHTAPRMVRIAAAIAAEAGGSPFFIDELVRSAEAAGKVYGDRDIIQPADSDEREATVAQMIKVRFSRLPADAQRTLELLAVNGRPTPAHVLKRAAAVESYETTLALLRTEHLLRTRETDNADEIETYHDRIRETVVANLAADQLCRHHMTLALAYLDLKSADVELIADHFLAAGEEERSVEYALQAAENAERAVAFDRAARLYRRTLDIVRDDAAQRSALQAKLGDALANAGRGSEAAAAYLAATPSSAGEERELKQKAASQLLYSGHIDEGLVILQGVLNSIDMKLPESRRATLIALIVGRIRVRLRGLRFRERDASVISPQELMRTDVSWSVAMGLALVDTIRGAACQTRALLLALRAGELNRLCRAMSIEVAYSSIRGSGARARTERLIERTRPLVEKCNTPYARAFFSMCIGIAAYLNGRWREGATLTLEAEEMLREYCAGATWEVDTSRFFSLWSQVFLGEMGLISNRFAVLLQDAQDRGDLYAATMFRGFVAHYVHLTADDPATASESVRDAIKRWSQAGFHTQHLWELWSSINIALYQGQGLTAWTKAHQTWPALQGSLLLGVQSSHVALLDAKGRAAVAAAYASVPSERKRLLDLALNAAKKIERQRTPWGDQLAALLRAGVLMAQGQERVALERMEKIEAGLDQLDMKLIAAAVRYRRGSVMGGDAGAALIGEADLWMRSKSIQSPQRMTEMFVPSGGE